MHLMTAFLTLVKDSDRVSSSSTLLSTYAAVFFPQSHQMLADEEQVDQHCHALASRDDQDRQHAPPTIAAATCIAPLAINKGFLSKSKLRTPSLFFYQSGDWCRESIFYIIVTTILSIQWRGLLQGLCSVRETLRNSIVKNPCSMCYILQLYPDQGPSDNHHHNETVRFIAWLLLQLRLQCMLLIPRLPVLLMSSICCNVSCSPSIDPSSLPSTASSSINWLSLSITASPSSDSSTAYYC